MATLRQRANGGAAAAESPSSGSDSHGPFPPPSGMRRASTAGPFRPGLSPEGGRLRRSSTLSEFLTEANKTFQEEIVHPGPSPLTTRTWVSWLPIVFAALPPIAGLFFKNGAAFCNDLILLGLASVFLHWSITFPW